MNEHPTKETNVNTSHKSAQKDWMEARLFVPLPTLLSDDIGDGVDVRALVDLPQLVHNRNTQVQHADAALARGSRVPVKEERGV